MVEVKVEAGICGFITEVKAFLEDEQNVSLKVTSNCEKISKLANRIVTLDAYNEIKEGFNGELYKVIREGLTGCCSGCAVPVGLFKSMQVAANLALPKDINIRITKK